LWEAAEQLGVSASYLEKCFAPKCRKRPWPELRRFKTLSGHWRVWRLAITEAIAARERQAADRARGAVPLRKWPR
jgi:hypothetical protein